MSVQHVAEALMRTVCHVGLVISRLHYQMSQ